jgi:hypothetical protein
MLRNDTFIRCAGETRLEWVLEHYPDRVQALFEALDLDRAGLREAKAAAGRGDLPAACRALLDYYRTGESGKWVRAREVHPGGRGGEADLLLADIYTDMGRQYRIPRTPQGRIIWAAQAIESEQGWMWNYLAYSMQPNGCQPQNNDSDHGSCRDGVIKAAQEYGRPDWLYIATNGAQGEKPKQGPSLIFPWAGQVIARSSWGADALWAFFDIGPMGFGHSHCDKLHLSVYANGRDLLIDPGRFTYAFESEDGRFQGKYAGLAVAHNVILIDDRGQAAGPGWVDKPVSEEDYLITPELTFARGTCAEFFQEIYSGRLAGKAAHTRAVLCLPNELIVVADRIETDRPRKLDALWHWHPRCTVEIEGQTVRSVDPGVGNLRIAPVAGFDWAVETVKGQEPAGIHGTMQGWYAHSYNNWEPSPASVFTARIGRTTAFAWLLLPTRGEVPPIHGEIVENTDEAVRIRICSSEQDARMVRIPWRSGRPERIA